MSAWTPQDEKALRAEIERRFAERTPPTRADEAHPEYRVGRSEMRRWCIDTLGKPMAEGPQETEMDVLRARWMRRMARRVMREKGE